MLDAEPGRSRNGSSAEVMQQPVFLQPVFVIEGLEELPNGVRLDQLHVGVGAIFLDQLAGDDGVAFANRTPFKLHFDLASGQLRAMAPPMTLPRGGLYQVSVQIEPQARLDDAGAEGEVTALEEPGEEASLVVSGQVVEDHIGRPSQDEPAPLPWTPTDSADIGGLRRVEMIPFSYSSTRSVRFMLADIELAGGESQELQLQLQVGAWVQETVEPALVHALDNRPSGQIVDDVVNTLEVRERAEDGGAGMDQLIGTMDVEVR